MSNAKGAFGTTFTRAGNAVAELTNISGISKTGETIDVSNHDSPSQFREFIGAMKDGGEVALEGNLIISDANGQVGLNSDLDAGTVQTFAITFPAAVGAAWNFTGIVTKFETTAPFDGKLGFSASIKVSGKPTLSITASTGLTTPFFAINNSAVINPAPAGNVYNYVATVLTGVTSVVVTPTASAGTIVITANGASQTVTSGQASSAIALGNAGSVTTITVTVTETGKTPKVYTILVSRP